MPPISDLQLGQTHGAVAPPSCVSRAESPTKKKHTDIYSVTGVQYVCVCTHTSITRKFNGKIPQASGIAVNNFPGIAKVQQN